MHLSKLLFAAWLPAGCSSSRVAIGASTTTIASTSSTSAPEVVTATSTIAPSTTLAAPQEGCLAVGHSAVVDRANQRSWICDDGQVVQRFVMTSAVSQPDPGVYQVYAKDLEASPTLTGRYSTMTHFVAFTRGKFQGARIAFHSIPKYDDGQFVQSLKSVGTPEMFGDSSGCIRLLPEDAVAMWDWLNYGDSVVVVS